MNIKFVLALSGIDHVSYFANRVFLALIAIQVGGTPFMMGVLGAAFAFFPMLLSVTAGRLSDRYDARYLMMFSSAGTCLGILLPALWPTLPAVLLAALICGFSQVFFIVSLQNAIGVLSSPQERARNFSNQSLTISMGSFLGPLLGGFAVDHFSIAQSSLFMSVLAALPLLVLLARGTRLQAASRPAPAAKSQGGLAGAMELLQNPGVRRTLYSSCLLVCGTSLYHFYMPAYAHSVGIAATLIGVVMSFNSAAAFVVRTMLPALLRRWSEDATLSIGLSFGAVALVLVPFFDNPWMLGLLSFVFGLGMGVVQPISAMQMFANSQKGRSGEGVGLRMAVNQAAGLLFPLAFGMAASVLGLVPVFWLNGLLLGAGSWLSRPRAGSQADGDKPPG